MAEPRSHLSHARAILTLGLPLVGSHLAQFSITLTDAIMLGWYDVEVLAAQVLGGSFFFILFISGSGFAWAITPLVAGALGRGDLTEARRACRMGLWLVTGFSILAMPVMLLARPMLDLAGQEPRIAALAGSYLSIAGWGIFPALWVMVLKSHLSALEQTRVVLWITLLAVGVNALGNYALIFGNWGAPEMGIEGAAVSSLLVHLASVATLVAWIVRRMPDQALFVRLWKVDRDALSAVFRLGWPIGLTTVAEVGLFAATSVMMGWLGALPLAAHGIALQIVSLTFMIQVGLANTATIRAGRAVGEGDAVGLRRGAVVIVVLSVGAALATMALFLAVPRWMVGLFVDPADPLRDQVIEIGRVLLLAGALFQLADAGQVVALGLLRGVRDTRVPMVMAGISYWVIGMPVSYQLGFGLGWGGVGVWLGLAFGLGFAAVTMMRRFWRHLPGYVPAERAGGMRPDAPAERAAAG